ncbi:MAG: aconitate hydratase AcnA, partial [Deltaproteobacteria bacterium CG_4_10_14_0_2_um_filter_43_8]
MPHNSFSCLDTLSVEGKEYHFYNLKKAEANGLNNISQLPKTLKVLLENLLRHENGITVNKKQIEAFSTWLKTKRSDTDIAYHPARVLMQDFTGVPAVVDLAAMRDAMKHLGADAQKINPLTPVDLVIDHSVQVDEFANVHAFQANVDKEMQRNQERYQFLRWGQNAFENFRVVPPGTGICHQVNLEHLGKVVWTKESEGKTFAYPDTLVGTDSHTTMINGLGILGWGIGGIEAEAAMLGQSVTMLIPEVVGMKLTGTLPEGTTATDLVLTVTQMLRQKGVVGKFVEFYGDGIQHLSLADRATISNMAPEYGATCGFFPVDQETVRYLEFTGRGEYVALVEAYAKAQGLWRDGNEPVFTDTIELQLESVLPSIAGPKRPQDRVLLSQASETFKALLHSSLPKNGTGTASSDMLEEGGHLENKNETFLSKNSFVEGTDYHIDHGSIVIAAITSCTNTSNPSVMLAAGLLAKKAVEKGLKVKPWVKTSLAPGSQVVTDYLEKAGLQTYLDQLGFNLVGYGCTTCIGNSGPLPEAIANAVMKEDLTVCSVLSGNRNFEGRINPHCKANYLASPPLVVAYALLGNMKCDLTTKSLGKDKNGNDVYFKDIWPSNAEIQATVEKAVNKEMFLKRYADVFTGPKEWKEIKSTNSLTYPWNNKSTYIQNPPYFVSMNAKPQKISDITCAKVLAVLGDSVTTDHISPAGAIKADSPAGMYLQHEGVAPVDFNSYGSRRGNHEVMMRGTFANIRIRNEMVPEKEGGYTKLPDGSIMPIYEAAIEYQKAKTPLVIIAGKEYGTGSSRDWAAKGTNLLGVKAVIVESFERIHRSNLIGMGVLPLQFTQGQTRKTLKLDGSETFSITG